MMQTIRNLGSKLAFRSYSRGISTINQNEVKFFNDWSTDYWNPNGVWRLLIAMNTYRVPLFQKFLTDANLAHVAYAETATPLRGIRILDVGCGGGFLSESLAKLGADVIGIDPSQQLIKIASKHASLDPSLSKHLQYSASSIEVFSRTHQESFDAVVSSEVIEHVDQQALFLSHCVSCLKPGGSIILTTLNRHPLGGLFHIYILEYVLKVMPKGTHQYNKFITPKEVEQILRTHNCRTRKIQGYTLNTFNSRWYSVPVHWFTYALHAVKEGHFAGGVPCKYAPTAANNANV